MSTLSHVGIATALLALGVAENAVAQERPYPRLDLSSGYSLVTMRGEDLVDPNLSGWTASTGLKVLSGLSLVVDGGGNYWNGFRSLSVATGPRVARRMAPMTVFGQWLVGGVFAGSTDDSRYESLFLSQPGFGIDVPLRSTLALRAQVDWQRVRDRPGTKITILRYGASLVVGFGGTDSTRGN